MPTQSGLCTVYVFTLHVRSLPITGAYFLWYYLFQDIILAHPLLIPTFMARLGGGPISVVQPGGQVIPYSMKVRRVSHNNRV